MVCLEDTEAVVGNEKVISKWLDGRSGTECTLTSEMLLSKLVGSRSSMLPWLWVGVSISWHTQKLNHKTD